MSAEVPTVTFRRRAAPSLPGSPAGPAALLVGVALALAGCGGAGEEAPAAAVAGGAPPLEIAVERPVGSPGAATSAPAGDPAAPSALTPRLAVRDVAASAAFYRELLGFVVEGEPPAAGDRRAVLRRGAMRIALESTAGRRAAGGDEPAIVLVLTTTDASALFDRLADRASLVRGLSDTDRGNREFAIADPDGHVLVFSQGL